MHLCASGTFPYRFSYVLVRRAAFAAVSASPTWTVLAVCSAESMPGDFGTMHWEAWTTASPATASANA